MHNQCKMNRIGTMPNKFPSWEGRRASVGVVCSMPELIRWQELKTI